MADFSKLRSWSRSKSGTAELDRRGTNPAEIARPSADVLAENARKVRRITKSQPFRHRVQLLVAFKQGAFGHLDPHPCEVVFRTSTGLSAKQVCKTARRQAHRA